MEREAPRRVLRIPLGACEPERAFLALFAREPHAFWLDSGIDAASGMSYLGAASPGSLVATADSSGAVTVADPATGAARSAGDDLVGFLRADLAERAVPPGVPGFALGWVGWFGYEFGARRAGAPVREGSGPAAALLSVDRVLAFDHATGRLEARVLDAPGGEAWAEEARAALAAAPEEPLPAAEPDVASPPVRWRHGDDDYLALVRRCQEHIRAGDAYQLCLTTSASTAAPADPVAAYRILRRAAPSHHGGLLRFGRRSLLSASPERFLAVSPRGEASSSPIKGTRPRGTDPGSDAALARELATSEKERAENLMITDLVRNDLARVAATGTVAVSRLHAVESYPQVHQLVSTVTARLAEGRDALDAFDACFPAGSMTGAPKRRAMELLHELEGAPRGAYAGAFGLLGLDGALDLAMTIRTIVLDGADATVGTGGGITAGSEPGAELAEARLKADALLRVLARASVSLSA